MDMTVPNFVSLPYLIERPRPNFEGTEIRFPESLVRYFLKQFTKKGDKILDPFCGQGTTLFVSESLDRIPFGIESDPKRYEWVAGQLVKPSNLVFGDSFQIGKLNFPKMDFLITSPPFMPRNHKWNPLYSGNPAFNGYEKYLNRMTQIFKKLALTMKRDATIVVHADNIVTGSVYTPLVRDLSLSISKAAKLEAEIIIKWENGKKDYTHTHCLVFKNH